MRNYFLVLCLGLLRMNVFGAVPSGYYYTADGLSKSDLKTALFQIISKANMLSYGAGEQKTWQGFFHTDKRPDGTVWDMYSDEMRMFNDSNGVVGLHIEHSLPKSWWGAYENNAYKDLFHLYPADGLTNITKSNLPLGEAIAPLLLDNGVSRIGINQFGDFYSGNCFEPANEYKGDFARSYLYMATAYENLASYWNSPMMDNNTYPVWKKWAIDLLLKWHREDPVSDKELKRQEAVYRIQGNRNPYIDYPDLAEYIWGKDTLSCFSFPTETSPFIVTPDSWCKIQLGVVLKDDVAKVAVEIKAKNLKSDLSCRLSRTNSSIVLSDTLISPRQASEGFLLQIDFHAVDLGYITDSLMLFSDDIKDTLYIPINGLAAADFMVMQPTQITARTGILNWMNVPDADYYLLDLYQGASLCGDLIISQYIEGTGWNKAIEIYNGTGKTVSLSEYSFKWQNNGIGDFCKEYVLSGLLDDGKSILIACSEASDILKTQAAFIAPKDGFIGFNGNDAVVLFHNGILVDVVGDIDSPDNWGKDCTLIRKQTVTHPSVCYHREEWEVKATDYFDEIGMHQVSFSTPAYLLNNEKISGQNSYVCQDLRPNQSYIYKVTAVDSEGNETQTYNSIQFSTIPLSVPTVLLATQVTDQSFTANWESVADATHYLIDLYRLKGAGELTEKADFNNVEAGRPLPEEWSGTASGSYSSAASSGESPNSIGLKANEWLQTRNYQHSAYKLSFMYRYTTTKGIGSYVILEGLVNGEAVVLDTLHFVDNNKHFPEYLFEDQYDAFRFSFAHREGTAYFALDDVAVTFGKYDTAYVEQNIRVDGLERMFSSLDSNTTYYYQIRSAFDDVTSDYSEPISVNTKNINAIPLVDSNHFYVCSVSDGICLKNIPEESIVTLFDMQGRILNHFTSFSSSITIRNITHPIVFIRVVSPAGVQTVKFLSSLNAR